MIFIEAESFKTKGGWVVDTASMESIHSSYLMAHGMGVSVKDAVTDFEVPSDNKYYIWALTRDWTAVWDVEDSAGKFVIKIDGDVLENTLGTNGRKWAWQLAGETELKKGTHTIALHDITGFNGRCDAVYITSSSQAPSDDICEIDKMRKQYNWKEINEHEHVYDLVVVGGGVAGVCTALTALRSGVSVALINDRPVLGGCNSSEVRVCMGGMIHLEPNKALGNIVKEIAPVMGSPRKYYKEYYEDNRKILAFECWERAEYKIFLNECVTEAEHDGHKITAVICTNTLTGHKTRIKGKSFADCSGDGILARKMGCEMMYGREARSEFNESLAPQEHENIVMGHSIRWYTEEQSEYVDFPDIDWNLDFDDDSCLNCVVGDWEQETGFCRDMVNEAEYIRDYGLRAIYSNWAYQKHHFKDKEKFAKLKLMWVSPIGGKRESYRVKGDYILTQNDIENKVIYDDATASMTWSIDMHFPEPTNEEKFGEAFRSFAYHRGLEEPYPVPYRCLYAKDVDNLFIGGRLVSMTHVAFSSVRVMRTLGCLGEVAGLASSICKKYNCTPRQVYTCHLDELKELMKKGVESPDAFNCGYGPGESYHFKDIGWWHLDNGVCADNLHIPRCPEETEIKKFNYCVKRLGIEHQNPIPQKWKNSKE